MDASWIELKMILEPSAVRQLKQHAEHQGISISELASQILYDYLKHHSKGRGQSPIEGQVE